jgi:hypothetical protein
MIGGNVKSSSGWVWYKLTPKETEEAMDIARDLNTREFVKCLEQAINLVEKITMPELDEKDIVSIAATLFEKQGIQNYTVLNATLGEKTHLFKNKAIPDGDHKPALTTIKEEKKEEIQKQVTNEFKTTQEDMRSAIDKGFEKLTGTPTAESGKQYEEHFCPQCNVPYKSEEAVKNHSCPADKT